MRVHVLAVGKRRGGGVVRGQWPPRSQSGMKPSRFLDLCSDKLNAVNYFSFFSRKNVVEI